MKKFVFFAGLAVVAMTSCSKTEGVLTTQQQTESVISFQPLAAAQTKSTPIQKYETTTGDFVVYGWYQDSKVADTFTPGFGSDSKPNYTTYMNGVVCSYDADVNDAGEGTGSWISDNPYYWPKNGKLTFSAYYPADAKVAVDAVKGITIADYNVADATHQVDLMYSDRVFDRVSSIQTDNNKLYDGVDLVFNHALSAADFSIKTAKDYGAGAIKIKSIKIIDAYSKGDFAEGYTNGTKNDVLQTKWSNQRTATSYTVYEEANLADRVSPTETNAKIGETCILLPQTFSESNVKIVVTYGIQYKDGAATKYLEQTAEFPLKGTKDTENNDIEGWEMGKWYHYTFTFTLDTIYFAPSVKDWVDVNVKDFEVVSK